LSNDDDARHTRESGTTNPEVGKRIGLSYSGVSRIRSGDRYPSLAVMRKIREAYGWSVADQQSLIPDTGRNLDYALEFERRINANTN
jgi:transcriptional regulator with XRE-family HTH domain